MNKSIISVFLTLVFLSCGKTEEEEQKVVETAPEYFYVNFDSTTVKRGGIYDFYTDPNLIFKYNRGIFFAKYSLDGPYFRSLKPDLESRAYFVNTDLNIDLDSSRFVPVLKGLVIDDDTRFSNSEEVYIESYFDNSQYPFLKIPLDSVFYMGFKVNEDRLYKNYGWCKAKIVYDYTENSLGGKDQYETMQLLEYCFENTGKPIVVGECPNAVDITQDLTIQ